MAAPRASLFSASSFMMRAESRCASYCLGGWVQRVCQQISKERKVSLDGRLKYSFSQLRWQPPLGGALLPKKASHSFRRQAPLPTTTSASPLSRPKPPALPPHIEAGEDLLLGLHVAGGRQAHVAEVWEVELEPGIGHDVGKGRPPLAVHHEDAVQQRAAGVRHVGQAATHRIHILRGQPLDVSQSGVAGRQ